MVSFAKEVAKETRNVTQTIYFVTMNCVVICLESVLKRLVPYALELAETFADEPIKSGI